jgi:hypothetical protein
MNADEWKWDATHDGQHLVEKSKVTSLTEARVIPSTTGHKKGWKTMMDLLPVFID